MTTLWAARRAVRGTIRCSNRSSGREHCSENCCLSGFRPPGSLSPSPGPQPAPTRSARPSQLPGASPQALRCACCAIRSLNDAVSSQFPPKRQKPSKTPKIGQRGPGFNVISLRHRNAINKQDATLEWRVGGGSPLDSKLRATPVRRNANHLL